ncbi:MAG: GNAT family N-acetyltransferase [Candidatus Thiodiazotropha lotti]|uniref:N-acetyltransferase domain-containing protein n=1 Tax=Candidatus Thiodiazotropha endoloripes TaxID=1818881 RepID=A0A1E2UNY1_9GAMM|nr:GNAT family N-acetyltransferase [Candidatus Thiodiazotropha endoloripes]MCG7900386.1 GNAT family N-acetyltransferase [Candidatus Thiodiazotropha weberae]MCG7991216.1 GNAT family N-acetyltransferase [Candidatus Thiodiazotropha lotti]MCG7903206.1 GNAT family N-acetyltransferase [Candidatus Thiodiazotropha weberae]MCG7915167.1 GNAT family N-acetyltransferase [Candidatus Thiodiazotropha weberae]MCG7998242.1 GNAT family N-acetyltransferase [Candidatus Thiodiazotropha lotti]
MITRPYKHSDYEFCEALVSQAWGFDEIFKPADLSALAKIIYTKGSLVSSNYRRVVEDDGRLVGFIFGYNEYVGKPKGKLLFTLQILWRLLTVRGDRPEDTKSLIQAIQEHQKNRAAIVGQGRSEIVLFVVAEEYQGVGVGSSLWCGFESFCKSGNVREIIVETNRMGASGFYEKLGFELIADFDSPLHEYATKGGQACMYEYHTGQSSGIC